MGIEKKGLTMVGKYIQVLIRYIVWQNMYKILEKVHY